jgi:hypothetical protein
MKCLDQDGSSKTARLLRLSDSGVLEKLKLKLAREVQSAMYPAAELLAACREANPPP